MIKAINAIVSETFASAVNIKLVGEGAAKRLFYARFAENKTKQSTPGGCGIIRVPTILNESPYIAECYLMIKVQCQVVALHFHARLLPVKVTNSKCN